MNLPHIARILFLNCIVFCSPLLAQLLGISSESARLAGFSSLTEVADWRSLEDAKFSPLSSDSSGGADSPSSTSIRRAYYADHFLEIARSANAFCEKYPGSVKISDAQLIEARCWLNASLLGESVDSKRVAELVSLVREDRSISESSRYEIDLLDQRLELTRRRSGLNHVEYIAAQERALRGLLKKYPNQAGAYNSLFVVLESQGSSKALIEFAKDVLSRKEAPYAAQARARIVQGRYGCIGRNIREIEAWRDLSETLLEQDGKGVIIYTWNSTSNDIIQRQLIDVGFLKTTNLFGVCVDRDAIDLKSGASTGFGRQLGFSGGALSRQALALGLSEPGIFVAIDSAGEILDVVRDVRKIAAGLK